MTTSETAKKLFDSTSGKLYFMLKSIFDSEDTVEGIMVQAYNRTLCYIVYVLRFLVWRFRYEIFRVFPVIYHAYNHIGNNAPTPSTPIFTRRRCVHIYG